MAFNKRKSFLNYILLYMYFIKPCLSVFKYSKRYGSKLILHTEVYIFSFI